MWIFLACMALVQPPAAPVESPPAVAAPPAVPVSLPEGMTPESMGALSAELAALVAKHKVPGLAAAVIVDGKVVRAGCAGKRTRGEDADVTSGDLWHLGSCAKSMTATVAATFVDRGELRWSMTLPELFPDETIPEVWRGVTLENLVTHRSGMASNITDQALWMSLFTSKATTREDRRKVLRWVLTQQPGCKPGEKFVYSNVGFMIAGHAIETRANAAFEDVIGERLFRPLGITSAGLGAPKGDQPRGHRGPGADAAPVAADEWGDNPRCLGPAGAFHMTITDWARYIAFHASGELAKPGEPKGAKALLPAELVRVLHTPPTVPGGKDGEKKGDGPATYAMGWVCATRSWAKEGPEAKGEALMHNGSNTMWYCVTWVAPRKGLAVVVACNQTGPGAEKACDEAAAKFLIEASTKKGNP